MHCPLELPELMRLADAKIFGFSQSFSLFFILTGEEIIRPRQL
jgi:hypothetical protein